MVNSDADVCQCEECTQHCRKGRTSLDILVSLITYQDARTGAFTNCERYKGATMTKTGVSKKTVASELSAVFVRHGLHRETTGILWKISDLHGSFFKARDWLNATGQGVIENLREM